MKLATKEQGLRDTLGLMIPYTEEEIEILEANRIFEAINNSMVDDCNE